MSPGRKTTGLAVAAALLAACTSGTHDQWADNEVHGPWRVVFTGHGTVTGSDDELTLEPTAATSADRTHAALVVTRADYPQDLSFSMVVRTERHTRDGDPNPWEVGWVLWNYQDNDHFYAVALKPNGWEVSKQDPAYPGKQRFLVTGHEPTFPIGVDHHVEVTQTITQTATPTTTHTGTKTQTSTSVAVRANGHLLGEFTDTERPYTHGAIGAYTEDARVHFSRLRVEQPATDQLEGRPATTSAHEQGTAA